MPEYAVIKGTISPIASLRGQLSIESAVVGHITIPERVTPAQYTGETVFTPSMEMQIVETRDMYMTDDITINPIPSNYGLITFNGTVITVS